MMFYALLEPLIQRFSRWIWELESPRSTKTRAGVLWQYLLSWMGIQLRFVRLDQIWRHWLNYFHTLLDKLATARWLNEEDHVMLIRLHDEVMLIRLPHFWFQGALNYGIMNSSHRWIGCVYSAIPRGHKAWLREHSSKSKHVWDVASHKGQNKAEPSEWLNWPLRVYLSESRGALDGDSNETFPQATSTGSLGFTGTVSQDACH